MKPRFSNQRNHALTITEVLVIISTLCLLVVVVLASSETQKNDEPGVEQRIACINNLRSIGLAYRVWCADHDDKYPIQVSQNQGGAMESAVSGKVFPIFQVMSNVMGTTKILVCPADTNRFAADNFTTGFDNSHISYFAGLDANETSTQSLIAGDSNLAIGGIPVKSGLVQLSTNELTAWTVDRHVKGKRNLGNVVLVDGTVAMWTPLPQLLLQTGLATNRLAIP
jgi:hypothetical protein